MSETANNKEQAILEAAEREFFAKGFDGARTTSIAAAAGVTPAMLHYYFRTKEHIFERILDEKVRIMGQLILTAFGRPELPLMERLEEGISQQFDFLTTNPDLPRFIVNEIVSKPERYEAMRVRIQPIMNALVNGFQHELDAAAERGECTPIDVRHLMLDIMSLNMFPVMAYPLLEPLIGEMSNDRSAFLVQRRQETIEIIRRRLQKI